MRVQTRSPGEGGSYPFIGVFTLDGTGQPGKPQVIDLGALGVQPDHMTLVGDGRVVAVGSPLTKVGTKTEPGAVFVFSFDRTVPARWSPAPG